LKVNYLQGMSQIFDPILDDVFWVRTMPTLQKTGYRLASAGPSKAWHEKQTLFSRPKLLFPKPPFFLVFQKADIGKRFCEYFIIAFGGQSIGFDRG
jgi:hypothetical protein